MIAAGATEVSNVEFLVSDPGKALDQAREAAIAGHVDFREAHLVPLAYPEASWLTFGFWLELSN